MGVVRYEFGPPGAQRWREGGGVERGEETDGDVEGEGAEGDEKEEEEVLQDEGLSLEDCRVGGRGRGGCGSAVGRGAWEGEFLDARPCQVDVEEEQEDAEPEDGALQYVSTWSVRSWLGSPCTSNFESSRPSRLKRRCRYTCAVSCCPSRALSVTTYLGFDQDKINEQHHEVVLDILVSELLAARTLCQAHALSQSAVVGFRVLGVQCFHRVAALYADGHSSAAIG